MRAALLPATDGHVSFTWTAPGGNYDYGKAETYKVLVNKNLQKLRDEVGTYLEGWPAPLSAHSIQQHTITWKDYDKVYYLGMFAIDTSGNAAILSNIVEIFVPSPPTSSPSTLVTILPNLSQSKEGSTHRATTVFNSLDTKQLVVVFVCVAGFLLIVSFVICYCTSLRRKNKNKPQKDEDPKEVFSATVGNKNSEYSQEKHCDGFNKDYLRPINSWSPSELLGTSHNDKRESISGRSDNNSEHSGSTKKSGGGSSEPPQYYNNGQYPYDGNGYNNAYPIPSDGYPTPVENYSQNGANFSGPKDEYSIDGFSPYASSQHSDFFLSDSCDMLPGSQGPPGYSVYPQYDNNVRGTKVPPPIPPKPKVHYTPEPYIYEGTDLNGRNSSNASITSEKRVRNVTMV